jgi:nucleotide-binding universal stress UspA family protein
MSVRTNRRSYEAGHRPKYLVVVDETPEWERALYFAARRCARNGAALMALYVMVPEAEAQAWMGVEDIMRAEAEAKADAALQRAAAKARALAGIEPELVVREGAKADVITAMIEEDQDISILVLAAGTGSEGPGPLVSSLAGRAVASFPIPVTIVPGGLSDAELDALT